MPPPRSRLPLALTLARIAAAPLVAGLVLYAHSEIHKGGGIVSARLYGIATLLFIAAAITDWLDGALARKLEAVSALGAALDHIADKILTSVVLIALAYASLPLDLVCASAVLIGRDLAIAGLRERFGAAMPVDPRGKLKAAAALAGVSFFLAAQTWGVIAGGDAIAALLFGAARLLIWGAALLALWSGAAYVRAALAAACG